jgi:acetoacetyl-CoA synthetase
MSSPSSRGVLGIAGTSSESDIAPLFSPREAENTPTHVLRKRVNAKYGLTLGSYLDIYHWSTTHIADFWSEVWDQTDIVGHKGGHVVDNAALPPDNPAWFAQARLNWAENMLRCRSSEKTALVEASTSVLEICYAIRLIYTQCS